MRLNSLDKNVDHLKAILRETRDIEIFNSKSRSINWQKTTPKIEITTSIKHTYEITGYENTDTAALPVHYSFS